MSDQDTRKARCKNCGATSPSTDCDATGFACQMESAPSSGEAERLAAALEEYADQFEAAYHFGTMPTALREAATLLRQQAAELASLKAWAKAEKRYPESAPSGEANLPPETLDTDCHCGKTQEGQWVFGVACPIITHRARSGKQWREAYVEQFRSEQASSGEAEQEDWSVYDDRGSDTKTHGGEFRRTAAHHAGARPGEAPGAATAKSGGTRGARRGDRRR